ncbi:glutathione S-transferase [Burkholderia thailandensis]|uniref:glutathione S-transferase family protein n=1 Tax=Burkholderia thailandensis TaxID=57975 RepID=UPI0012E70C12|nr:glutathione S-transferase [Burkholderia thailandensis]MUV24175.1 glutathione S-transferase [Burkholderia thailandensis]
MPAHRPPAAPIRLHRTRLSGHCHRVELFLSLLGLPVEFVDVDMRGGANRRPEFLALNPFGQVPVIEDGEFVLFDSNAILVYLAKRYGDPSWLPDDPPRAAAARLVTLFGAPLDHASAIGIARRLFDVIEPELAGKRFATGDDPTIADVAAYAYIAHAPEGGVSLDPYPNLRAWLARIEALPGFVPMPASRAGLRAADAA